MTLGLSVVARITGDGSLLEAAVAGANSALSSSTVIPFYIIVARATLALVAVQRADATAAAEQYAALKSVPRIMFAYISTDRLLGLLSHTLNRLDSAVSHFEDALAFSRRAGYRPEYAWTCYDYAEALFAGTQQAAPIQNIPARGELVEPRARGNRQKALSLLDEALTISTELGMRPLMERVATLQEKVGLVGETRRATPVYPDGLSQREVEVLRLIAQGQSNREIAEELVISEGTARRHVSNIYDKIGATNRAEATRYALRTGLLALDGVPSAAAEEDANHGQ